MPRRARSWTWHIDHGTSYDVRREIDEKLGVPPEYANIALIRWLSEGPMGPAGAQARVVGDVLGTMGERRDSVPEN